jgi:predicted nuclease of predicted toxin-antitoxin system
MRLLIDMNLSPKWVAFLDSAGFDARHWSKAGAVTASDHEIMARARAESRIVLTSDLDFGAILAASGDQAPSVVQIRADDLSIPAIGQAVVTALRQCADDLAKGALVTVDPRRSRLTLLPIGGQSPEAV